MNDHSPHMDAPADDTLVYDGQPLKVLRTFKRDGVEYARLGGYLVKFSGAADPDLTGDYFTASTDFGTLTRKGRAEVPGYYQHGFDPHFKGEAIGDAELSTDEFGVWAEYQIELRSDYERHLVDMASKGLMGQSSGAVGHLVERRQVAKSYEITRWPIGEASLTPTPAEPRTSAVPLKSLRPTESAPEPGVTVNVTLDAASVAEAITKQTQPPTAMQDETKAADAVETPAEAPEAKAITSADVTAAVTEAMKAFREDAKPTVRSEFDTKAAPTFIHTLGDNEAKALAAFFKSGDTGGVRHMMSGAGEVQIKASNATDMNITTDADGGYAVPTGHFGDIIARRDELAIASALGVRRIPGVGTTVNVPLDAEADGEFVSTAESASYDLDGPAIGQKAFTLVKYTKEVRLTEELLQDEESRLLAFIADFVGRGSAKTHNDLLLTEVAANGTNFKTFAATGAIADGELEDIEGDDDLGAYLEDNSVAWVMRNSTLSHIRKISGSDRVYAADSAENRSVRNGRELLGYPVFRSNKAAAIGTAAKSVYFGNWSQVGLYEAPTLTVTRDPYTRAKTGEISLFYGFRADYGVLQAEAIGYGTQAAS